MRILVCGDRNFYDWRLLEQTLYELNKEHDITDLIHGDAAGADRLANQWAMYNKTWDSRLIRTWAYPADWKTLGVAAGPIRNKQMLEEGKPDLVIAFLAPNSKGTANMIKQATEAGVKVEVHEIR